MARILLLGCGRLASQLPETMAAHLGSHEFYGVRRTPVQHEKIQFLQCDLQSPEQIEKMIESIGQIDLIVHTATPSGRNDAEYQKAYIQGPQNVLGVLKAKQLNPYWLHVSSTGVFQHSSGEWVHENTPVAPQTSIARILRQSEELIETYGNGALLRLGGIYGQGRNHLISSLKSGRKIQNQPWSYTNRIHELDAVRAIAFLIEKGLSCSAASESKAVPIFHGVDDEPAPVHQVAEYVSKLFGIASPQMFQPEFEKSLTLQNKRVGNRAITSAGFKFKFANFRQGFDHESFLSFQ